jgi:uncharacterized protein (TIGR01777 family)
MDSDRPLRIVIAGGNGSLGQALIQHLPFAAEYTVLSRQKGQIVQGAKTLYWDGENAGAWKEAVNGSDVVINLCGRSVDCRYSEENKKTIINSRVLPTLALGKAMEENAEAPRLWINASSATIYRYSEDRPMDEATGEYGSGFSVDVCLRWEEAFASCRLPHTRKILLRISMVLGEKGGVLPVLLGLARKGLAGTMGSGNQYMSWVHEKDFVTIVAACIKNDSWQGPINCTAPEPIPNRDFMKLIRTASGALFGLPAPAFLLEIGAFFLRTETELVLKSRRVIPGFLLSKGFEFKFGNAQSALKNLTSKKQ